MLTICSTVDTIVADRNEHQCFKLNFVQLLREADFLLIEILPLEVNARIRIAYSIETSVVSKAAQTFRKVLPNLSIIV